MRYSRNRCLAAMLVLSQVMLACSSAPSPLMVRAPEPCEMISKQTISLNVQGGSRTETSVKWTATLGTLSKPGEIATNYTAPEVTQDTPVTINASVTADGLTDQKPVECIIKPAPSAVAEEASDPVAAPLPVTSAAPSTPPSALPATSAAPSAPPSALPATSAAPSAPPLPDEASPRVIPAKSTYERIIEQRRFAAIVRNDCTVFACPRGNKLEGFEVDMMREFARRWFERDDAVEFIPVNSEDRIPTLTEERGDVIAATLTVTSKRQALIAFSTRYYQDGQRILIQAASTGINGPCDLQGRKVGVVNDSSGIEGIIARTPTCSPGFSIEDNLTRFASDQDAIDALRAGEIAAFTTDGILLDQLTKDSSDLRVVGNDFTEEPYAFGVRKEQDDRFLRLVNLTLEAMRKDGTYRSIHCKHFGNSVYPYPIAPIAGEIPAEFETLVILDPPQAASTSCSYDDLPKNHTVQRGDWLSKLAKQYYGNSSPDYWQLIYRKNEALIGSDPDQIKEGSILLIPELPASFTSSR